MASFEHDLVEDWTPVEFSLELCRRMRRDKRISHVPSLRTTLAIPKLLTARYFRTRVLTPRDYIECAVLNTVPEDQAIAEEHARELLFPRPSSEGDARGAKPDAATQVAEEAAAAVEGDATDGILGDLADLGLDLDSLGELSDLESLLDEQEEAHDSVAAFDLFERLYASAEPSERSLAELVVMFGGPGELSSLGARTLAAVESYVQGMLSAQIGDLRPDHIAHGIAAGFGQLLLKECAQPWELAGALAGARPSELRDHLEELLGGATARELGKTMVYLRPFEDRLDPALLRDYRNGLRARARDLNDLVELCKGLDEWLEPNEEILQRSVEEGMGRALSAATWIVEHYSVDLGPDLFARWMASLDGSPSLEQLTQVVVDCDAWNEAFDPAFDEHLREFSAATATAYAALPAAVDAATALPEVVIDSVAMASALEQTGTKKGSLAAGRLCTEALCVLRHQAHLLPLLEAFLDRGVLPDDVDRVVAHVHALGIDPDEIYDRIGDALRQLEALIRSDGREVERYMRLADRVRGIPEELLAELAAEASRNENLEAIACLLAIDLGGTAQHLGEDEVMGAIGYKGIGTGPNQLRQWFRHRSSLHEGLREQIKAMTKDALVDLAFDWIGKGGGSGEQGLLPQAATRPYRAGDDLDLLDLDGTLESLVGSGKRIEDFSAEDLTVQDTARGKAALGMLIDISGSMTGDDLAVCAIAAVMLLGRVRSEEVALAVFESNTHVVKDFADHRDLDEVADHVLELEATGGTRVDAAFQWAKEQFASASEADFQLLFVLSDFCFWEEPEELARHGRDLAELGVVFVGASHGYVDDNALQTLLRTTSGQRIALRSVAKLPQILLETLQQIGDGAFR